MVSLGLAVITAFPFPSSWVAAKSAWKSANTVWSISIKSVSGWKFAMVSWPKLAANTNVSLSLGPVAAGEANAFWVVASACVPVFVVSPVGGCAVAATLLAGPVSASVVAGAVG